MHILSQHPYPILAVIHDNKQYLLETYWWEGDDLRCQWINSQASDAFKRHFAKRHFCDNITSQIHTLETVARYLIDSNRFFQSDIILFIHGGHDDGLRIM